MNQAPTHLLLHRVLLPQHPETTANEPAKPEQAQGSQPSEEPAPAVSPEVSEGKPRRSVAKPPGFKYDVQRAIDSNNNVVDPTPELPTFFHGIAEASRVTRIPEYCLTAMEVLYDLPCAKMDRTIPKNYNQAVKLANYRSYWLPAMEKQVKALEDAGVYSLVKRTPEMHVLPGKWVYDEKYNIDLKEYLARARWVVCGNFEHNKWDLQDIYAAVANSVSVRLFLCIMAINDFECEQYDFNTAFLNALIPEDGKKYYVEQPTGLEKKDCHTWVCQLVRALYGLKRSPLFWFETLLPVLKALGFTPIGADLCLLVNNTLGAIMVLYVDDFLLAAANLKIITHIKGTLEKKFKLKHLGPVRTFLGFDIVRNRTERTVFISQERYTKTMIDKFTKGLAKGQDLHPTKTPWPPDVKIHGGGEVSGSAESLHQEHRLVKLLIHWYPTGHHVHRQQTVRG